VHRVGRRVACGDHHLAFEVSRGLAVHLAVLVLAVVVSVPAACAASEARGVVVAVEHVDVAAAGRGVRAVVSARPAETAVQTAAAAVVLALSTARAGHVAAAVEPVSAALSRVAACRVAAPQTVETLRAARPAVAQAALAASGRKATAAPRKALTDRANQTLEDTGYAVSAEDDADHEQRQTHAADSHSTAVVQAAFARLDDAEFLAPGHWLAGGELLRGVVFDGLVEDLDGRPVARLVD